MFDEKCRNWIVTEYFSLHFKHLRMKSCSETHISVMECVKTCDRPTMSLKSEKWILFHVCCVMEVVRLSTSTDRLFEHNKIT